jgi:hypothetical protein
MAGVAENGALLAEELAALSLPDLKADDPIAEPSRTMQLARNGPHPLSPSREFYEM